MDEPKEGATTLKKKAQEKLAAKANPVVEEEVPAAVVADETPVVEAVVTEEAPVVEAVVEETPAAEASAE
jgi:small subunit ribosomal protein S16